MLGFPSALSARPPVAGQDVRLWREAGGRSAEVRRMYSSYPGRRLAMVFSSMATPLTRISRNDMSSGPATDHQVPWPSRATR